MPTKIKISLRGVSRTFVSPQGERIEALRDINFKVGTHVAKPYRYKKITG